MLKNKKTIIAMIVSSIASVGAVVYFGGKSTMSNDHNTLPVLCSQVDGLSSCNIKGMLREDMVINSVERCVNRNIPGRMKVKYIYTEDWFNDLKKNPDAIATGGIVKNTFNAESFYKSTPIVSNVKFTLLTKEGGMNTTIESLLREKHKIAVLKGEGQRFTQRAAENAKISWFDVRNLIVPFDNLEQIKQSGITNIVVYESSVRDVENDIDNIKKTTMPSRATATYGNDVVFYMDSRNPYGQIINRCIQQYVDNVN